MSKTTSEAKDAVVTSNTVIVDMGAVESKLIKELKLGKGELTQEVNEIIDEISDQLKEKNADKVYIPVVIIYEHKS